MISWLLTNCLISVLALTFIHTNTTSPHRLRFLVGFTALSAWLVPWQKLAIDLPAFPVAALDKVQSSLSAALPYEYAFGISYGADSGMGLGIGQILFISLLLAGLPGLLLFLGETLRQGATLQLLKNTARNADHLWDLDGISSPAPILVQDRIPGAFTSGLFRPVIWLHASLVSSPDLKAILLHESTHIRYHDNLFLVIITLVEKLFWWNPAARILAARTRALQELSCDESCSLQLHDYREMLASLILGNLYSETNASRMSLAANMFTKKNADVERIRLMERRYSMKPRHIFSTAGVLGAAVFSVILFAQDDGETLAGTQLEHAEVMIVHGGSSAELTEEQLAKLEAIKEQLAAGGIIMGDGAHGQGGIRMHKMVIAGDESASDGNYTWHTQVDGDPKLTLAFTEVPLAKALHPLAMTLRKPVDFVLNKTFEEELTVVNHAGGDGETRIMVMAGAPINALEGVIDIKDELANDIRVSIRAEDKTVSEIIDLLSLQSGCNIYIDGEKIVVDACGF